MARQDVPTYASQTPTRGLKSRIAGEFRDEDEKQAAAAGDDCGTLWPIRLYPFKPLNDRVVKAAGRRILCGSELIAKTCRTSMQEVSE
jgi:hypothetical protein